MIPKMGFALIALAVLATAFGGVAAQDEEGSGTETTPVPEETSPLPAEETTISEEPPSTSTVATTTTTTTTAASTPPKSTAPASTQSTALPPGTTKGPTNITCNVKTVFAKPNETVTVICSVFINTAYMEWSEWVLEAYFKSTEYRLTDAEIEAAKVSGVPSASSGVDSYPRRVELVFSATRDKGGDTWISQPDHGTKYSLHLRSEQNTFALTIANIGFDDDGVLEFVLRDRRREPVIVRRVFVNVYQRPESIDVVASPTDVGKRYEAVCTVRSFFPPKSVRVRWTVDGSAVGPGRDATESSFWWLEYPDGVSFSSKIRLWKAKESTAPPNITCWADWAVENARARCNASVVPKMFKLPDMFMSFKDGYAVCDAYCVRPGVTAYWMINGEEQPPDSTRTATSGVCREDPSKVNVRSQVPVYDTWGKAKYTCRLRKYPMDDREAEISKTLDSTPVSRGKPLITVLVVVFGVALVLGLIVLSVALCFYRSSGSAKYRRYYG